jgi:hypothetical protein
VYVSANEKADSLNLHRYIAEFLRRRGWPDFKVRVPPPPTAPSDAGSGATRGEDWVAPARASLAKLRFAITTLVGLCVTLNDSHWSAMYTWTNEVTLFRLRPIGVRVCWADPHRRCCPPRWPMACARTSSASRARTRQGLSTKPLYKPQLSCFISF